MSAPLALIWFCNSLRGHPQTAKREAVFETQVQVDEAENNGGSQAKVRRGFKVK